MIRRYRDDDEAAVVGVWHRFGISLPPESAPDVEYHWRPQGSQDGE